MSARSCWRWAFDHTSLPKLVIPANPEIQLPLIVRNERLGLYRCEPLPGHDLHRRHNRNLKARTSSTARGGAAFAARYQAKRLIHIKEYPTVLEAIFREKALKKWLRDWKIELIETHNPDWLDLFETLNA